MDLYNVIRLIVFAGQLLFTSLTFMFRRNFRWFWFFPLFSKFLRLAHIQTASLFIDTLLVNFTGMHFIQIVF